MSLRQFLAGACAALLAVLVVLFAVRVSRHFPGASAELGRTRLVRPSSALRERLDHLDSELLLSWYGSSKSRMPSDLRHLEEGVMGCLRGLEAAGPGLVRVQRIDPEADAALGPYLSSLGIAPFRARRVERDSYTEESVWSSLRIAYGPHGASTIARLGPDELSHLQDLIAAHLDELESPRRPRIALSAPHGYGALRRALAARADLQEIDFDAEPALPSDVDLCFWIDPKAASAAHVAELERFLAHGKSLVIAGSRVAPQFESSSAGSRVRFSETGSSIDALSAQFGLRALPGLALDARSDEGAAPPGREPTTFLVRAIAPNQDFRTMSGQPNGSLWFAAPTLFEPDAERLAAMDLSCTVLATSSESTWIQPDTRAPVPLTALQPEIGKTTFIGARALLAILRPADPWRGSLVFAAASTPFQDEYFTRESAAHEALVSILVSTLASGERRAAQRVAFALPAPLQNLSLAERAWWRAAVVFGLPLAVAASVLTARFVRRRASRREPAAQGSARTLALPSILVLALVCALPRLVPDEARLDWTRGRVNELASATRTVLARASAVGPVALELVFSEAARLPPELRPRVRSARELVARMQHASPQLSVESLEPEVGDAEDEARFAARGFVPVRVTSRSDEVTTVRRIYAAIAISRGGGREILPLPDAAAFDELEFKLAAALERLSGGRRARVAFASDVPRPSPAESLARYQKKGLFAPGEGDVYSESRDWLVSHGFDVSYVDPRDPQIPADIDLLVWLQPRRDVTAMLRATARHLSRGGKVLLAAQHFHVRSRQEQGRDLALSLWPEPQFPDLDRIYFQRLGIEFPREVLFDALAGSADLATEVDRGGGVRAIERQGAASPLLIRAVAANFDQESQITHGLGDQLFIFGNRLAWDPAVLARHELRARPLITSSERTWSLDWSGGDLPPAALQGPPAGQYLGRQTLAAEFEGRFPPPESDPALAREGEAPAVGAGDERRGQLIWIGCSDMFKNGRLHLAGFDHAQLLLRSAAHLALGDELTSIVARGARERGFDPIEAPARATWRAIVLGAAPLALILVGLVLRALRQRAPLRGVGTHAAPPGARLAGG